MFRSHTCGELRIDHAGQEVTLAGWVQTIRKFGAITFIDLRDRYGLTQLFFGEELNILLDQQPLGREFVLQVKGIVTGRTNKNPHIPTGDIELTVTSFSMFFITSSGIVCSFLGGSRMYIFSVPFSTRPTGMPFCAHLSAHSAWLGP